MNLIPTSASRVVNRKILIAKKNSPHIFFGMGVAGTVVSTVLACRATLKLEAKLDNIKHEIDEVKSLQNDRDPASNYPARQYTRDLTYVYTKGAKELGILYGPSIIVGALSVAALTGSHIQLTRRNTALTATLAVVSKAFEDYRARVREELGVEHELEISQAVHNEKDDKNKIVKVVDPDGWSPYAVMFDESNPNWIKNAEYNRVFLQAQQNYANHKLHARGHVFLNEIYESLGFEHTTPGAVVGWVSNGDKDNFIDFGLYEAHARRFVMGEERSIILDFNVDGVIFDKI